MRCGGYPGCSPARAGCRLGLTASGTSPARVVRCRPEFASSHRPPARPRARRRGPPSDLRRKTRPAARVRARRRTQSRLRGVNHDADVLHPLDSHVFDGKRRLHVAVDRVEARPLGNTRLGASGPERSSAVRASKMTASSSGPDVTRGSSRAASDLCWPAARVGVPVVGEQAAGSPLWVAVGLWLPLRRAHEMVLTVPFKSRLDPTLGFASRGSIAGG
jgi:hypothetical protein